MKISLRKRELSDGRKSLYLDIYHLGKRRYEFLNLYLTKDKDQNKETKALADKIRAKRETELQNNVYGFTPQFKQKISVIKYFQKQLENKPKGSTYHSAFKHFKTFAEGDILFQEIDEKWLDKFRLYLLDKVSQNSAMTYFIVVKSIFKKAKKEKIISTNPAEFVDNIKFRDVKRDFLTIDQLRILAKTDYKYPDIKRAFLFSCFTGLRYSDIKKLTWAEVKSDRLEIKQQKTQEYIYIPLSQTAKDILNLRDKKILHLPDTLVFNLFARWATNFHLKEWFKKAGIDMNAHFHLGRHSHATMLITSGTQIYTVSKLLGHKNLKTTEIYSKLIDEKKKEAIESLPLLEINND